MNMFNSLVIFVLSVWSETILFPLPDPYHKYVFFFSQFTEPTFIEGITVLHKEFQCNHAQSLVTYFAPQENLC